MNVIVICSDTFRYDHLGFLKEKPVHTPRLDELATQSAAFNDFWLCSFPTMVNRIEVFSGRYTFPFFNWGPLPFEYPVLSEVFKRHGFTTALLADNLHMIRKGWGYGRGFDFVKEVHGQVHDPFQPKGAPMVPLVCPEERLGGRKDRLDQYRRNAYWYRQQETNSTATLFRAALDWLEKPRDRFFMWIDAFDPHEPWDAPEQFLKPYPWNPQGEAVIWPKPGPADIYSEADFQNMCSLYAAEVSQIDYWMGQLLDHLRSKSLLDDTAVIFCSDHGIYFGEHGLVGKPVKIGHLTAMYEELGHLPLLLRHPSGLGAGQRIEGIGQPPDLFATALELAGIPRVPWAQGNSLVSRLQGESSPQQFAIGGYHPHRGRVSCMSLWSKEWSLMYSPTLGLDGSELYHIPTDPTHRTNVITDHRSVASDLLHAMEDWLGSLGVPRARQKQLLYNAPFGQRHQVSHQFWLWQRQMFYWRHYRHYATGG